VQAARASDFSRGVGRFESGGEASVAYPVGYSPTILVADDEVEIRDLIEAGLRCRGYKIDGAADGEEALTYLRAGKPLAAVLLDILMPRKNGIDTLREIRACNTELPVIMLSGASSTKNVVEAMRIGATDFIPKPVIVEDLRRAIKAALDAKSLPPGDASQRATGAASAEQFISNSPRLQQLKTTLSQVGQADVPVLILGETGVGKEVFAKQIHASSKRNQKIFLKLNCAALPSELVESELFGYERGAFTGAFQRKPGMFELADGGTLMLDEIGDMDLKLQSKLLQVLQDQEFHRVGGRETVRVNVRVLAATHRDLESEVDQGRFRADLFYRLNVISIRLPALRERTEDIAALSEFLLNRHASSDLPASLLTASLKQTILEYHWPGNVRELENVMRRLAVLRNPLQIEGELRSNVTRARLRQEVESTRASGASSMAAAMPVLEQVTRAKEEAETHAIMSALNTVRWNRKRAASLLNIDYKALLYKMKKLGIEDTPHND
jgi:two-component system, NtrC family, response regulator AtoC